MLPNMYLAAFEIGPLKISPTLLIAIIAVFVLGELSYLRARRVGLNTRIMVDGILLALIVGLPLSHVFLVAFYLPNKIIEDPLVLIMFWKGLSSIGVFFGGFLTLYVYLTMKKVSVLEYFDAIMFGAWPAWILGRLGCTMAFDHAGRPTDFFLGMEDRFGVVRHNLGFYDMFLAVFITAVLYKIRNMPVFPGFYFALSGLIYASGRLFLDFLRVTDRTYWGLTPGQYGSLLMMALALYIFAKGIKANRRNDVVPEKGQAHTP